MYYATNYDVGERKRETGINEDSVAITVFEQGHRNGYREQTRSVDDEDVPANRSTAVFALADGAGGYEAGDVASYLATTVLCEKLSPIALRVARSDPDAFGVDIDESMLAQPTRTEILEAIETAIVEAHRRIIEYAAASGTSAYTTVVAGLSVDGTLYYGWVGDSRAYVLNHDRETIERITKDHAVVEELSDAGELDEVESHVHPRGNEITRALGGTGQEPPDESTVEVDTNTIPLFAEDVVLVTSDGIIDAQTDAQELYDQYLESGRDESVGEEIRDRVVTDADIREWVLSASSLDDAVTRLIEESNERGGKDNLSALLFADPTLEETPERGGLPVRAIDPDESVEDRETVLITNEDGP